MAIGQSSFPVALDTQDTLIRAKDGAQSTVASPGIDAVVTTIPLASAATFPTSGVAIIEGEEIVYTGVSGNSLTGATRGAFAGDGGGPAAAHATGVPVKIVALAATHRVQNDAIIATQTKLGTGASTAASGQFLKGTGAGASAWSALASGEVTTALGFAPANKAGDGFLGPVSFYWDGSADGGVGPVAASGMVRFRNSAKIKARNAADSADITIVQLDSTNQVSLANDSVKVNAVGAIAAASLATTGGVTAGGLVTGTGAVLGTNPAGAGAVRIPNAQWLAARNAANSADVNLIRATSGNVVEIGASASVVGSLTASGTTGVVRSDAAGAYLTTDSVFGQESAHIVYAGGALRWIVGRPASSDNWVLSSGSFGTTIQATYATGAITLPALAGTGRRLLSASAAGLLQAGTITTDGSSIFASGTYNASALAGSTTRMATINTFGDLNAASGVTTDGTSLTASGLAGTGSRLVYAGATGTLTATTGLTTNGASLFITGAGTINAASIAGTGNRLLQANQFGDVGATGITLVGSATATWDPATVNYGTPISTTVAVSGATAGDIVVVGFSGTPLGSLMLTGFVESSGTVKVVLANPDSLASINPGSGTLRVLVLRV